MIAKATLPAVDAMNRLERSYSNHLQCRKLSGDVYDFWFEAIKIRLADNTYYTPDFLVILADGAVEFHETKGWWKDDARVKFKLLPELFPFPIVGVQWVKKAWVYERITAKKR